MTNRNNFALPAVFGALLLTSFVMQAAPITINLAQTAQNFTMGGLGPNGSGLGTYTITMGACAPSGGNTTCTLSGTFTGTAPGLTSGTYSLVTVYAGTGPTPLQGVQQAAGSNFFQFSVIPAGTTMTLTLVSSSGTLVVPVFAGGQFINGATFNFNYVAPTCSGAAVPSCAVGSVGLVAGSVITGVVTGSATFGNTYYFSHLAYSGGYQMTLTYVNYSPQPVTCLTTFYNEAGGLLSVPFGSGTVSTRTDVLQPGASFHDTTIANLAPPFVVGWAVASCTGSLQASLLYRYFQSGVAVGEAGINAELAPTTEFATFAQTSTGVAYANPSTTQSATVTVAVYSAAGAKLASTTLTLGPLGHTASNLGPLLGLTSFTGFVKITSNIPIISFSLNFEAFPVFSSLPPGDLAIGTSLIQ